jgi:hypothetical protein
LLACDVGIRRGEIVPVEEIEELEPEGYLELVFRTEAGVLQEREIFVGISEIA